MVFHVLNFERTAILLSSFLKQEIILSPVQVADQECIYYPTKFGERLFRKNSESHLHPLNTQKYHHFFISKGEKFIVQFQAKPCDTTLLKLRSRLGMGKSLFKSFSIFNSSQRVENIQIELVPEIILHRDASNLDIFRALIVLHRSLYSITNMSYKHDPISNTCSIQMLNDELFEITKEAHRFESEKRDAIQTGMQQSGWEVHKFLFGVIRPRDVW